MSPPAAAAAEPKQRRPRTTPTTKYDRSVIDRRWVNFDLKKFLATTEWQGEVLTAKHVASELDILPASFYYYGSNGRLPYRVYQGLIATFAPERAQALEKGLVIHLGGHARMSSKTAEAANRYHRLRPGAKIKVEDGSFDVVPDGKIIGSIPKTDRQVSLPPNVSADLVPESDRPRKSVAPAVPPGPLSIDIPGVGRLLVEQPKHQAGELDLLLGVTARLYADLTSTQARLREAAGRYGLETEELRNKLERSEVEHQAEVARLKRQLHEAETMLEQATNPEGAPLILAAPATPEEMDRVKATLVERVKEKSPALGEFIRTLPFEVAHLA